MSVNWKVSARLHRLPPCVECDAAEATPCVTASGVPRSPHRVRERVAAGELFVISADQAREGRILRRLRELAAAISGKS